MVSGILGEAFRASPTPQYSFSAASSAQISPPPTNLQLTHSPTLHRPTYSAPSPYIHPLPPSFLVMAASRSDSAPPPEVEPSPTPSSSQTSRSSSPGDREVDSSELAADLDAIALSQMFANTELRHSVAKFITLGSSSDLEEISKNFLYPLQPPLNLEERLRPELEGAGGERDIHDGFFALLRTVREELGDELSRELGKEWEAQQGEWEKAWRGIEARFPDWVGCRATKA